ncbi:hypothetical protein K1T71_010261 [Dendrolimus kikuchii]|uniref:Uncharacterized protein n=1 Tax=Dendrolimus kikuchii TaxID=765133 RepID=A0ACC1CRB3_9NEOP|nr:hypothetical protein K1T71_010261 [Dendrolimus kikuchii]
MHRVLYRLYSVYHVIYFQTLKVYAGISPVHDFKEKLNANLPSERFLLNSPHNVLKHLDNSILKATKNVTSNPQMEETLYQLSKDLVSSILSKLEIQDKITRITTEALEASGKNKGITAIETRRILDYISRTLSGHILSITRASTEPELHRLVYGLGQIAAEVSIVSALKDITYATALSRKQSIDLSLRRKRSISSNVDINSTSPIPMSNFAPTLYNIIFNGTTLNAVNTKPFNATNMAGKFNKLGLLKSPYSILTRKEKSSINLLSKKTSFLPPLKGFLNQTALEFASNSAVNETKKIVLDKDINNTDYVKSESDTLDVQQLNTPILNDDWMDTKDNKTPINSDIIAEMEFDQTDGPEDEVVNEKRAKQKLEKMEVKAKKAILYVGDVAYLTAASVVALRRALTASIEVQMSVRYAKNGMSNHQDLMMNLAKTAAQQAGKEAKSATSKSLACERVIKLALKYTAQSRGAKLNHVANRIIMDTLSLATLAKSMAFVASDIAINSLYEATDVKSPT